MRWIKKFKSFSVDDIPDIHKKVIKELGYTDYNPIGEGGFGSVYNVYDGNSWDYIVKITTDEGEAKIADYFSTKNYKHTRYYDVRTIFINNEKSDKYSIVSEKVNTLTDEERSVWFKIRRAINYSSRLNEIIDFFEKIKEEGIELIPSLNDLKDVAVQLVKKMINQIDSIRRELDKFNLRDAHEENIGFKDDGTFVVFDPSFSSDIIKGWTKKLKPIYLIDKEEKWIKAINDSDIDTIKMLLKDGFDPSKRINNIDNWSVKIAAIKGKIEIVKLLFQDDRVSLMKNRDIDYFYSIFKPYNLGVIKYLFNVDEIIEHMTYIELSYVINIIKNHLQNEELRTKHVEFLIDNPIVKKHGREKEVERLFKTYESNDQNLSDLLESLTIWEDNLLNSINAEEKSIKDVLNYIQQSNEDIEDIANNVKFIEKLSENNLKKSEIHNTEDYETFMDKPLKFMPIWGAEDNELMNPRYLMIQIFDDKKNKWSDVKFYSVQDSMKKFYDKLSSRTIELSKNNKSWIYRTDNSGEGWELQNLQMEGGEFKRFIYKDELKTLINEKNLKVKIM